MPRMDQGYVSNSTEQERRCQDRCAESPGHSREIYKGLTMETLCERS